MTIQLTNTGVTSIPAMVIHQQHRRVTNLSTYTFRIDVTPTAQVDYIHSQMTIKLTIHVAK